MYFQQRGIGLLELMLSLAVIAIILLSAARYYLVTDLTQKINQEVSNIRIIAAASQEWWEDHNHNLLTLQNGINELINYDYLKENYQYNVWGGNVGVLPFSQNIVTIRLDNITQKACYNLMNKFNLAPNWQCQNPGPTFFIICYDNTTNTFFDCTPSHA